MLSFVSAHLFTSCQQRQQQQHQLSGVCRPATAFGSSPEVKAALDSCRLFSTQSLCRCLVRCVSYATDVYNFGVFVAVSVYLSPLFLYCSKVCCLLLPHVWINLRFALHVLATWCLFLGASHAVSVELLPCLACCSFRFGSAVGNEFWPCCLGFLEASVQRHFGENAIRPDAQAADSRPVTSLYALCIQSLLKLACVLNFTKAPVRITRVAGFVDIDMPTTVLSRGQT